MDKKFKLTECTKEYKGKVLHRIQALIDIPMHNIDAGGFGGWVEKEKNLSQVGQCWVGNEAMVYGDARIDNDAVVFNDARVYGNARVFGNAYIFGMAEVYGHAAVSGYAEISGNAKVYGYAMIYGDAKVSGRAKVYDNAQIFDRAMISDNVKIYGNAAVCNSAEVRGNAKVKSRYDYTVFQNTWSSGRDFTYTRSNKMWKVGCFYGTGEELIKKAYKDSELSGKCYEMHVNLIKQLEEAKNENE